MRSSLLLSAIRGKAWVQGGERRIGRVRENMTFFSIAEVAERLNVSTRTVRRWIAAGDLMAHRIGGVVRIAKADFRLFLAAHYYR
jgi:excisionase family DNA binding protein